ncbi:GNAT family N-acetyltransferase [Rapidithrix thailandica]|uniref:GNAT family N-acetyltransferase n=1 Tax=Rapidithrix thailandica TaxID=413964 RepID=A0AAW9SAZ0_9BACT
MELTIRQINEQDEVPYELLLLADPSKKLVDNYLQNGTCFLALNNQDAIGVMVLLPTHPETMEIVNIAVREDAQGQGVGTQMLEFAVAFAKQNDIKTLEIGTANTSVGPLILYQKCGFRITGIDKDFFIRHYEEEIYEHGIRCTDMIRLSKDL